MLLSIHTEMTREALGSRMSTRAIDAVIAANLGQDSLRNQFGHDEFHFDNNAFEKTYAYIQEQRDQIVSSLKSPEALEAWRAFGRLTHTVQDFYSHSNYVSMWLDQLNGSPPSPAEIDPVRNDLIESPNLYSSKVYLPMDVLYFIPGLRKLALKFLPEDSHGKMNLDAPSQGPKFAYARVAAIKRTVHEFEILKKLLTAEMFGKFVDL